MKTKTEVATIIDSMGELLFTKMVEAYSTATYDTDYVPSHRAELELACYLKKCGLTYEEWEMWLQM